MSSDQGGEPQLQEEADPGPKPRGEDEITPGTGGDSGVMVTAKGAGLNPNAKVWQEIPAAQTEAPADGTEASPWSHPSVTEGKQHSPDFTLEVDSTAAGAVTVVNGTDHPEQMFPGCESTTATNESEFPVEELLSDESLRESLKKQLEFCFSRENLSKDLYLISQMDSDQFIPIWTLASMEGIKVLTTDVDLILEVLRSSPLVQVDERGEKVRPNHKRCIIILREVPETTPVEEVESLFNSENCPAVISVEFAHNNSWYITFQSDTDAQQAYRYLREEVKTFQGKPIMARIKAINTFFAKNGYRSLDCSTFPQPPHSQSQYSSPLFMQPVYSPQQQYPLYGLVPPTWTPSPTPYFETPLAPFPNSGFVNGFSSGHYKTASNCLSRPFSRSRNHVKPQMRVNEGLSSAGGPVALGDGLHSPQAPNSSGPVLQSTETNSFSPLSSNETSDDGPAGRGRRTTYRGTRRRREDDRTTRPAPLSQVKAPPPKFDLAASNFPPLPGCSSSPQGELVLENRLSDVVRGLNRDKPQESNKEAAVSSTGPAAEEVVSRTPQPIAKATARITDPVISSVCSSNHPEKKPEKAEPPVYKEVPVPSAPVTGVTPAPSQTAPGPKLQPSSATSAAPQSITAPSSTPALEPRKLSYAEVCQRPPKDPPPPAAASSPSGSPASAQPLRELRVNKVEEQQPPSPANKHERPQETGGNCRTKEGRPARDSQSFTRSNGPPRTSTGGFKLREQQRRPPFGHRGSPQGGSRHAGKEQNIPPVSPK